MVKKYSQFHRFIRRRKSYKGEWLWIPHRKRTFLYWYKYLQEAERSPDYQVDWTKYRGWGGSKTVLNFKFDDWWDTLKDDKYRWEKLFGYKERGVLPEKQKFPLSTTQPNTEAIRISLLCWYQRNVNPDDYQSKVSGLRVTKLKTTTSSFKKQKLIKSKSNKIAIARAVIKNEKRKGTPLWGINPDDANNENERKMIASLVGRYLRNAKSKLDMVSNGTFG